MIHLLIGFCAGIISGAGMGGGTVLIPLLTLLLNTPQKEAQTINLIAYLPAASAALFLHCRAKRTAWPLIAPVLLWGILGSAAGLALALFAPAALLKKLFGGFLIALALVQWQSGNKKANGA